VDAVPVNNVTLADTIIKKNKKNREQERTKGKKIGRKPQQTKKTLN
jgi:hypothetical protein